jgi:hypothetical protein
MIARTAMLSVRSGVMVSGCPSDCAADLMTPVLVERSKEGWICQPCAPIPSCSFRSL